LPRHRSACLLPVQARPAAGRRLRYATARTAPGNACPRRRGAGTAVSGLRRNPAGDWGWDAEIHRLCGELTGRLPHPDPAKAEESFRTALAIARKQGTRGYELRAATSLARLWGEKSRRGEARELLAPVYGWFTEGFDTPDLKEAKALNRGSRP